MSWNSFDLPNSYFGKAWKMIYKNGSRSIIHSLCIHPLLNWNSETVQQFSWVYLVLCEQTSSDIPNLHITKTVVPFFVQSTHKSCAYNVVLWQNDFSCVLSSYKLIIMLQVKYMYPTNCSGNITLTRYVKLKQLKWFLTTCKTVYTHVEEHISC